MHEWISIKWKLVDFVQIALIKNFLYFVELVFYDDISINRPAVINASILFHHPCFPEQCGSGFGKILVDPDVGSAIKWLNSISNIRINGNVNIRFVIVWGSYIWCLLMLIFLSNSVIIITIRVVACWSLRFYWFPPGFSRGASAMWWSQIAACSKDSVARAISSKLNQQITLWANFTHTMDTIKFLDSYWRANLKTKVAESKCHLNWVLMMTLIVKHWPMVCVWPQW